MLTSSLHRIESNRRLLRESDYLIAASRRLLNPAFTLSGAAMAPEPLIREIVRALLQSGDLPPLTGTVAWAGKGTGKMCCVCGEPVNGSEVEYEPEDGKRLTPGCHLPCFLVWQDESRADGLSV